MPLRLQIDSGGEKYFSFAKQKLEEMKRFMRQSGLKVQAKHFFISTAEHIWIKSLHVGFDVWLDWIRITAGGGSIILQTNLHEYSIIRWDGSLVASVDTTGHPWSGYRMHEAIGTRILFDGSGGEVYVVEATDFSIVAGPGDFSLNGFSTYTYWQPPAASGVLPAKQWVGGPQFGSSVALTGAEFGPFDQDITGYSSEAISGTLASGSVASNVFSFNSDGSDVIFALGYDSVLPEADDHFVRLNVSSGAFSTTRLVGSADLDGVRAAFPVCTNSSLLLRGVALNSGGAYIEAYSLADGSLIGRSLLTTAVSTTNLTWTVLRCDETRAIAVFGEGGTPTSYLGFTVDLATLASTDITTALTAGLSLLQLGNTSLSRAIILEADITGAIVAAPEGGGGGGGGPR